MISLFLGAPEMKAASLVNYNRVARVRINVEQYDYGYRRPPALRTVLC